MIQLFTGLPGSGKSLSNVSILHKQMVGWMQHHNFDKARPIFVHGIPDLLIPHSIMPVKEYRANSKPEAIIVPDWDLMPDHSVVLIDECANMFPPRSSASAMPPHVLFLTIHRKRGFDIWFTTQHPKFIDHSVRALVGKHQHYRRLFGGSRSIVYEWDSCSDSLAGFKGATKTVFSFPRDVFKLYKSAEIHTEQKFRLPAFLIIPVVGLALAIFFIPQTYSVLSNGVSGKGFKVETDLVSTASSDDGGLGKEKVEKSAPSGSGGVSDLDAAPAPIELVSACLSSASKCVCYTYQGVKVFLRDDECRKEALEVSNRFRLDTPSFSSPSMAPM